MSSTTPSNENTCSNHKQEGNEYKLYFLKTDEDLIKWSKFCKSCFSYKTNPPSSSFFLRKFTNDPLKDISLIFTITHQQTIVSSTRIFHRTSNNKVVGGIGEVCTSSNHQKKGLAKRLLNKAIDTMRDLHFDYSVLHASSAFWEVYGKVGYKNVSTYWTCFSLCNISNNDASQCVDYEKGDTIDVKQMSILYETFMVQNSGVGYLHRSEKYWENYILNEYREQSCIIRTFMKSNELVGYIVLKFRDHQDLWQVMDFAIDESKISYLDVLYFLCNDKHLKKDQEKLSIKIPTFMHTRIVNENKESITLNDIREDDDHGWMYLNLKESMDDKDAFFSSKNGNHIIWPIDSF